MTRSSSRQNPEADPAPSPGWVLLVKALSTWPWLYLPRLVLPDLTSFRLSTWSRDRTLCSGRHRDPVAQGLGSGPNPVLGLGLGLGP